MIAAPILIPKATRLRSMTGYAETVRQQDGVTLTVSVRSVNHRFLNLHMHLPEALLALEQKLRREVQIRGARGHLDLRVAMESGGAANLSVDEAMVGRYIELFRRLAVYHGIPAELDAATLCRLPGIIELTGQVVDR